jgi:hypothetical protein
MLGPGVVEWTSPHDFARMPLGGQAGMMQTNKQEATSLEMKQKATCRPAADSRDNANQICARLRAEGGACIVRKNSAWSLNASTDGGQP